MKLGASTKTQMTFITIHLLLEGLSHGLIAAAPHGTKRKLANAHKNFGLCVNAHKKTLNTLRADSGHVGQDVCSRESARASETELSAG
jgi:hypothetical protein